MGARTAELRRQLNWTAVAGPTWLHMCYQDQYTGRRGWQQGIVSQGRVEVFAVPHCAETPQVELRGKRPRFDIREH